MGGLIPSPIPGVLSRARAEDLERFYVASLSIVVIRSLPIFRTRLGKPSVGDFIREAIKLEYRGANRESPAARVVDESASTLAANELNDFLAAIDFERTVIPIVGIPWIEICFH